MNKTRFLSNYLQIQRCSCGWYAKPLAFDANRGSMYHSVCPACGSVTIKKETGRYKMLEKRYLFKTTSKVMGVEWRED